MKLDTHTMPLKHCRGCMNVWLCAVLSNNTPKCHSPSTDSYWNKGPQSEATLNTTCQMTYIPFHHCTLVYTFHTHSVYSSIALIPHITITPHNILWSHLQVPYTHISPHSQCVAHCQKPLLPTALTFMHEYLQIVDHLCVIQFPSHVQVITSPFPL